MLNVDQPKNKSSIIKVIGIGGGGSNAVNHMHSLGIEGVDFIICNTDNQSIEISNVPIKIQLGEDGHGAGSIPEVGKQAAEHSLEKIKEILQTNTKMLFITAGMGGGTGTGAAPVIAKLAREMNILSVAIVTTPFKFEGQKRMIQAESGMEELRENVDALLVINNDKLLEIHGNPKITEAFKHADDVLSIAARGIAEIITKPGLINVDFEDVKTVLTNSGTALMGSATTEGEERAIKAAEEALSSPLLNDNQIEGAENILLNISYHEDEVSTEEIDDITRYIQQEAGHKAEVIWGLGEDTSLGSKINVTVIATGFKKDKDPGRIVKKEKIVTGLYDNKAEEKKIAENSTNLDVTYYTLEGGKDHPVPEINTSSKTEHAESLDSKQTEIFIEEEQDLSNITEPTRIYRKQEDKEDKEIPAEDSDLKEKIGLKSKERIKRLRDISIQLKTPQDIAEIEKVPAYLRKKVELTEVKASDESQVSRYTLGDDGPEISENNSYIHDNVD